jgi:hypothetical protein
MKDEAVSLWPMPPEQYAANREAHDGAYEATEPGGMIVSMAKFVNTAIAAQNCFFVTRQQADVNPTDNHTVGSACVVVLQ